MTFDEEQEARRPWRNSLIIKLVGRSIGYRYIWRRIQAIWRTQAEPMLIDLCNDYFTVKLHKKEEHERALLNGPWMIGEHYLHVHRWKSNFRPDSEGIKTLQVWVRFPILPLEYYTAGWLKISGNNTGKTIKVDMVMLIASRGNLQAFVWRWI